MGNCCKKTEKKEDNQELNEQKDTKATKNEEILYATIEHSNPSASNEQNARSDNTCEYAVINYNCKQETITSEQDTQEYEEVIPN
ncbi:uncharacterized protein si:ch211-214p13.7 [Carcharodon carcharias]|uniref:uncharacterized protein si:ch211-214p13.7 n=1 Tax=Carcharodon carcharias TaxID=13397 RepID=UPI001B7F03F7|nr:uncharacterized protein si:ch211-214p13.7 [Carcharodon carcharias]